jgi:hypothetical protein
MKKVISNTLVHILRPLVKLLIKRSVPFGTFVEYAKWVYVDVASEEFGNPLKKNSNSKIAAMTGISRHEIKLLLESPLPDESESIFKHAKAARVISGWLNDSLYIDAQGKPLSLNIEGEDPSFTNLINKYCGDLPSKPIMEELLRIGSVSIDEDGKVKLENGTYIPYHTDDTKLEILGSDVADLIKTISYNIETNGKQDFLQLKSMGTVMSLESKNYLRKWSKDQAFEFLTKIDQWITEEELKSEKLPLKDTYRAGVGIFYFEEKNKGEKI